MPQQTNLNVSPYFDDYDPSSDFHKVLFKPGYPVQARELTNLQSILQNQIEKFGQHFFKEGSKVIPGNTGYTQLYYNVQLNNAYQGVPVSAYSDQLIGLKITGQNSGVTAVVDSVLLPTDSANGNLTLYVNYINSNTANNLSQEFFDNEELVCSAAINSSLLGNSTIPANSPFAVTIPQNASSIGSAFQIQQGVYFIRGNFIQVDTETLILDQYSNRPNYRIGLQIREEIITSDLDQTLNDNSQGFNNYSAPGADRLKISVSLFKKPLDDFDDNNFIELAVIEDGIIRSQIKNTKAGSNQVFREDLMDTLAQRTFEQSGHYVVKPFDVSVFNSLNNNLGNNGLFVGGEFTYGGSLASDDLAIFKISSGKAYVKGYEIETSTPTFIDVEKPRTTNDVEAESLSYNTGSTLKLNRVFRTPAPGFGIGNTYVISLRDERCGSNQNTAAGREVGLARVYDFRLESGSYSADNASTNEWGLSLFDVQPFTKLTLNQAHTLTVPTFVKGANSGATAFLRDAVTASTALTLYERNGSFVENESLIFNGNQDGRIAIAITEKSIADVKSVFATDDRLVGSNAFAGDVIQTRSFNVGVGQVNASGNIESSNPRFLDNVKVNDLITYSDLATSTDKIMVKVTAVNASSVTVEGVQTVAGIVNGNLPGSGSIDVSDMDIVRTSLDKSSDNTLYTKLTKQNIATINLDESSITIRKVFDVDILANGTIDTGTTMNAGDREVFLPFVPNRYSLIRNDTGETIELTENKMSFNSTSTKILNIFNIAGGAGAAKLVTTLKKSKPKSKVKNKINVNSLIVDKSKLEGSGIGTTTLNNGLEHGNYPFGTRVEDEIISINAPDILEIHGVFESSGTGDPIAPKMTFSAVTSQTSTTQDVVNGEILIGQTSGAIAICVGKPDNLSVSFIVKNQIDFIEGETAIFQDSLVEGIISVIVEESFNISSNYTFSSGQRKTIYGHSSLRRRKSSSAPTKKLITYFASAKYDTGDTGDITTVESYTSFDYATEIQSIDGISNSDIIDVRPRVSNYTVSEGSRSPLEFEGRTYNQSGNSGANILASKENLVFDFSYYLGRIDRLFLTKDGKFQVVYGTPAEKPEPPVGINDAMEIASIKLPPYLFNTEQASIKFLEHKRYRMSDIKQLENRIRNLEYYTSLSLLESKTESAFIADSDGLNRFKSGFFVDNFNSFKSQEMKSTINNSIDRKNKELRPKHYTNSVDLIFGPVEGVDSSTDFKFNVIDGENISRSSDIVTLNYSEVNWLQQTFATRSETITPFTVSFWQGTIELTPASDTWVDTVRVQTRIIETEGNYAATVDYYERTNELDPQTGFIPILWDSWETNWTGVLDTVESESRAATDAISESTKKLDGTTGPGQWVRRNTTTVSQEEFQETFDLGTESRGGTRTIVHEEYEKSSINDRTVSRDLVPFMRSRNIEFNSRKLKPGTEVYPYFDGVDVSRYCTPKLIEITMTSGTFTVGENVRSVPLKRGVSAPKFYARIAQINHKEGEYNSATRTYEQNPYNGQLIPSSYNSTSTILNIDTYSLSNETQGEYYGYIEVGTLLVGESSGATATVSDLKLVVDNQSSLIGSFYIPETITSYHPRFESGIRSFTLSSSNNNDSENVTTIASELYSATGIIENEGSVRNIRLEDRKEFEQQTVSKSSGTQIVGTSVVNRTSPETITAWYDPLAQTFTVDDETGIFVTRCDIFFRAKDDMEIPITLQIRTVEGGIPTSKVLPMSEVILDPDEVSISTDSSIATSFTFKAPIYLEGRKEYAICLSTNSTKYTTFVSRIGQEDFLTDTLISSQPFLGSLFKSQNASGWEASQWEDLKFTLYRAEFEVSGSIDVYNPRLSIGNKQVPNLLPNSIELKSRKLKIVLSNPDNGNNTYLIGNSFTQAGTNAIGNIVGAGGSATGDLTVSNGGLGYIPSTGAETRAIPLTTLSGNGSGASADITFENGVAIGATITTDIGGSAYQVGDVLSISGDNVGRDLRLTVAGVAATNTLILDNVIGDFIVNSSNGIVYNDGTSDITFNASGSGSALTSTISNSGTTLAGQLETVDTISAADASRAAGTYNIAVSAYSATGSGTGATFTVVVDGAGAATVTRVAKGNGYVVNNTISISDAQLGGGGGATLTFDVATIGNQANQTYSDVAGIPVGGSGSNIKFNVVRDGTGAISGATISAGGIGYAENDSITITGDLIGGAAPTDNVTITINDVSANSVYPTAITPFTNDSDGRHIKINHLNHGMYFDDNRVEISGVESDVVPTRLSVAYAAGSTAALSVEDNTSFGEFENFPVGNINRGYLKVGDEVIEYTATSGSNTIGGTITRGANKASYPIGTLVYKYELSGINLARINKIHDMNDVTVPNPITLDSYYIKLDTQEVFNTNNLDRSVERLTDTAPTLYIRDTKSAGGYGIKASQNISYGVITPMIQSQTVQGSTISAQFRSTTTAGISGNEIPFVDNGFEPVTLNKPNFLSTPRAIFSKVNEDLKLTNVPGNKSMTLRLFLNTIDTRVSPVIDSQRMNTILSTNRINNPISNYITDPRVNSIDSDPSAFQYISRELSLENSATSLKIDLNAYINTFSDIRAFYCIGNEPTSTPIFTAFPGFSNLKSNGNIINLKDNDGHPDVEIQKTNVLDFDSNSLEYKEYTFTMDNLEPFRYYRIKLVMSSTNQIYVPRVKDLRVIALA
ncbi:MAG: hypothetical protein CMO99_01285 [Woeseiaceae bacterium]|nr:hypothetical protein [Woeseiaceae bacterium]